MAPLSAQHAGDPISILLMFYLFFLSGGIAMIAFLPAWVQTIAQFIPTHYGVHAL